MTNRHRRRVARHHPDAERISLRVLYRLRAAQKALSAAHSDLVTLSLVTGPGADRDRLDQSADGVRAIALGLASLRAGPLLPWSCLGQWHPRHARASREARR